MKGAFVLGGGIMLLMFILPGCNLPQQAENSSNPNPNDVATQIQMLLTAIPQQTQIPVQITAAPSAAAPLPSATPTADSTPTSTLTPSAVPTVTPILTAPPSATATLSQLDPKSSLGPPTRADSLDTAQNWGLYTDNHTRVTGGDGYLTLAAYHPNGWRGWALSYPKLNNFYLEVTAKPGTCAGDDSYGTMVRSPDGNHGYIFVLSCDGKYRFEKWDGRHFTDLITWEPSPAINAGSEQANRLGVMAKGSYFTLYVNGQQVGEIDDSTYEAGVFGLVITAYKTPDFTVQVDEVDYWNITN